jgi:hypothetical protein
MERRTTMPRPLLHIHRGPPAAARSPVVDLKTAKPPAALIRLVAAPVWSHVGAWCSCDEYNQKL